VTVAQFQEFLRAHPEVKGSSTRWDGLDADVPVTSVTWYEAAQYCRWLSEREEVPPDQMCYPPVEVIEKCKDGRTPLRLPEDHLARAGYRLPTEAEYEYAARADARTGYYHGSADDLLPRYAWCGHNSRYRAWPVGQKRPNDFGLFDMHGNVWQWCQESYRPYRPAGNGLDRPAEDEGDSRDVTDGLSRVLRGGSFYDHVSVMRSANRNSTLRPTDRNPYVGLRVARTCR
jgi:formylglycine-generating enzyme required for sulfatase activity